ncbi:DUF6888 family protein [Kovacikia minuta]|uniref:DUF6888 family protein n=1 Tax=Kovacikia minuta TaxID=2931930 RepID=UPI0036F282D8
MGSGWRFQRWYRNLCVRIEERAILPTAEQDHACLRVCQMLSNGYKDIHLFRFDPLTGNVYILAGDSVEVNVPPSGLWNFL